MKSKFLISLMLITLVIGCTPKKYNRYQGSVFSTSFHIIYDGVDTLNDSIDVALEKVNYEFSTYMPQSIISRINQNDSSVVTDSAFINLFIKAGEVWEVSGGAFDITVAPLVNAWGFGFTKRQHVTPAMIDSIRQFVGFEKVRLQGRKIIKSDPRIMFDASAISKGYSVDAVAELLLRKGVDNFMVEIGGEVRTKGFNEFGKPWGIAIEKPVDDRSAQSNGVQNVLLLSDLALATSGNYRNFYIEDGKKYAHTINPHTGYPAQTDILSSSVIAKDCMTADAYATAFMVLGLEKSLKVIESHPEIEGFFIVRNDRGELETRYSAGVEKLIKK